MNENDELTDQSEQGTDIGSVTLTGFIPIHPCWHMRTLVSSMVDGTLTGLMRRYTLWHLSQCTHCTEALAGLERLRGSLQDLPATEISGLSEERHARIQAAWNQANKEGA